MFGKEGKTALNESAILIVGCLLVATTVVGCATNDEQKRSTTIVLTGSPITVNLPNGFVAADEDEVVTYPRRPMRHFHLPELPNGGTPMFPDIYIEQLAADEVSLSLDSYVSKAAALSQYGPLPFAPKTLTIDGVRAIEFAKTAEMIADFEGGGAGHADMIDYEIVFQYEGKNYHCMMEAGADGYAKYVSVFEGFCASVRFMK